MRILLVLLLAGCSHEQEITNACAYSQACMQDMQERCEAQEFKVWVDHSEWGYDGPHCRPMTRHEKCNLRGGSWQDIGLETRYDWQSGQLKTEYNFSKHCVGGR